MTEILSALAPVFLLILIGFVLRKKEVIPLAYWAPAEKLTYYLFFPALLVANGARADLTGIAVGPMAAVLVGGVLLVAALAVLAKGRLGLDGPAFTSVFQGSFRPNVYVGIAAASALFGEPGLTLFSVSIVILVPTVNLISVLALVRYGTAAGGRRGWRRAVVPVITNPLILACLAGALLNAAGLGLPPVVGPLLDVLGRAALPVGLMAVGAGLSLAALRAAGRLVAVTTVLKLGALPLFTLILSRAFGLDDLTAAVCLIYAALPCSASSYVLARQMGGDEKLIAGVITATTLAAVVTLPVWAIALGGR